MDYGQRQRELQLRREALRLRSAELRLEIAGQAQVLQAPLAWVDQARKSLRWLRTHPEWPLGALVLLLVVRPRRTLRWGGRLWWGWGLWQQAQRLLQGPAARQ